MKVQLSVRADKLKNVAGLGKGTSDPFAVATLITSDDPQILGKTEVIKNTLSPNWTKVFVFDYELGHPVHVALSLFDEVRKDDNKSMGSALFDIGAILGTRGNTKAKKMKGGGTVYAHVEKYVGGGTFRLQMRGVKLKNTEGFMKKSDPFFELSKAEQGTSGATTGWDNVFRSRVVKDNLSPLWSDSVVDLGTLCGGNLDHPIKVSVYDHESSGKHVPMGDFETTVNGLIAAIGGGGFTLTKKGKTTGQIEVVKAETVGLTSDQDNVTEKMAAVSVAPTPTPAQPGAFVPTPPKPSFIDYVSGGCELNLCVAIDFTGSNGDPRQPGTLHHIKPDGSKNDYEKAISAIGEILAKYDSNKQFPVWGFGAKYGGIVRHCFQCGPSREVHGVDGILQAYRGVFQSGLVMSGPTVFTEVIQTAAAQAISAQEAAQQSGGQAYTILLILTDGAVSDVNATATVLNQVNDAPLSVVIVGIGGADFSSMRFLDDFKKPAGKRDVAQFVELNAHLHSKESLTAATLHEIPDQLVEYFSARGIMPLASVHRNDEDIAVESQEEEIDLSLDFGGDGDIVVAGGGKYSNAW